MRRRTFVEGFGTVTALALAGCSGGGGGDADTTTTSEKSPGESDGSTTTETPARTTTEGGLDLREANVTAVEFEADGTSYEFSVTLYHDDDGEAGYANWWQVETLDGERLGRRDLLHAHGTRQFTRSATVEIPGDVACVVVRGHDQTHGDGGQAALVNLDTGATKLVRQGSDPRSFTESDCP